MSDIKKYGIDWNKGILNDGSFRRLKRVMKKAQAGEDITVGFIGGSITQGCLSSTPETCYAYLVYQWWKKKFPQAEIVCINAGIGGTTSEFGAARADSDLLKYKVDFAVVEFSVNDEATLHFKETFESLIRKIYLNDSKPAILIVNSVRYDNGDNAQDIHNEIGRWYQIPCISMKSTIYDSLMNGKFAASDITQDNLHPNDLGHELMAAVICNFLEKVYADNSEATLSEKDCQMSLTESAYEKSVRYQNDVCCPELSGFIADSMPQNDIREIFRKGWTSDKEGAYIRFEITGSCFAAQYRKSVNLPTPIAKAVIDGDEEHSVILDGNFDETWGDSIHITTLAEHIEYGKHVIEIRIIKTHENDQVPFYLVSVIGA